MYRSQEMFDSIIHEADNNNNKREWNRSRTL